jgi:hypothetical protein
VSMKGSTAPGTPGTGNLVAGPGARRGAGATWGDDGGGSDPVAVVLSGGAQEPERRRTGGSADQGKSIQRAVLRHT